MRKDDSALRTCDQCSEELTGKVKYAMIGKPPAFFCSKECLENYKRSIEPKYGQ
jgi:hypothetical protein